MKRLLLGDGESAIRDALAPHVDSSCELVHVASGGQALAAFARLPVGLVVLEQRLPDLSGLDLLARIKRSYPRLPVVMVTGSGSERVCAAAFKLGARDYFAKPCDPAELWASLHALLSLAPSRGEPRENVIPSPPPPPISGADGAIPRAMRFIQDHYADPITLEAVARQVGVGKFTLSRNFQAAANLSFRRYLLQARITKAKELLADPRYNVTEVAHRVGFNDLQRFGKVFRSLEGLPPSGYRAAAASQKGKKQPRKGKKLLADLALLVYCLPTLTPESLGSVSAFWTYWT